jgi:hypothetical protein
MSSRYALCLFIVVLTAQLPAAAQVSVRPTGNGFDFVESGHVIAAYQRRPTDKDGKYQRSHYLHPVVGLNGAELTEDFPTDHLHHRGIFWAWHQLTVDGKQLGDPWVCQRSYWDHVSAAIETTDTSSRLNVAVHWSSDDLLDATGKRIPIVLERSTIEFHPRTESYRLVDIRFSLEPLLNNVSIGGSDDQKGYGGFSVRMKLKPPMQFLGEGGEIEPTITGISGGRWVNIQGPIGPDDSVAGIAMLQMSASPKLPQPWILRRGKSMQNAAFPGQKAFKLSKPNSVEFHYRLVIHAGNVDAKTIQSLLD